MPISDLGFFPMILICAQCHKHWKLPGGKRRSEKCPDCMQSVLSKGSKLGWDRRRSRVEAANDTVQPYLPGTLAKLISEADAVSERVAKLLALRKP